MFNALQFSIIVGVILLSAPLKAGVLAYEDFEDSTVLYSLGQPEGSDSSNTYWGRVDSDGISINESNGYAFPPSGNSFFAGENVDNVNQGSTHSITFTVDISNHTDLNFSGYFATESNSGRYDGSAQGADKDSLRVSYSIDGGGFSNLFYLSPAGTGGNQFLAVDSNLDGIGEGDIVSTTFTEHANNVPIPGTGDSLALKIQLFSTRTGEGIAFDDIMISGTAVPEPQTTALAISLILLGVAKLHRSHTRGPGK